MMTRKINVGKGLLRLYLVLWMLLAIASFVVGHKEVLTYLGSTYWSAQKAAEAKKFAFQWSEFDRQIEICRSDECRDQFEVLRFRLLGLLGPGKRIIGDENDVSHTVEMWALFVLVAPAVLLIILTALFKLLVWVLAGFKAL